MPETLATQFMDHYFRLTDCGNMFRLSRGPEGSFHSQENNSKGALDAPSCPWYFNIGLSNQASLAAHPGLHSQHVQINLCYCGGHLEDDGIMHIMQPTGRPRHFPIYKDKVTAGGEHQVEEWRCKVKPRGSWASALLFEYMRHVSACIFYSQYFAYCKYALSNAGRQNYKRHENAKICIQNPHQRLYNTATTITTIFDP